ncbi:unnamed protein product [Amaranthus hypochondriacus]
MSKPISCTIFLLTLIILLLSPTDAQNSGNITVGQSLTATINGSSWLSPSGEFAFGFYKLPNTNNLFLLAIWYANIPNTVVWYANSGNPVPQGSLVKLTVTDGLILSDPQGHNLWNTSTYSRSSNGVSYGFMNDTGNFSLKRRNDQNPFWQSFDHPTDTLVPGQSLEMSVVLNSRLSETDYRPGRFQVQITTDGSMQYYVMNLKTGLAYTAYHISDLSNAGNAQKLVYNESGYMYILRNNGSTHNMLPDDYTPSEDVYQRTTLSHDGVLDWYSIPKSSINDGWTVFQSEPGNLCHTPSAPNVGTGICGFNSLCSSGSNSHPTCMCPPGYSFQDPDDIYSSCKPDFKLSSCEEYAERAMKGEYKLLHRPNTDFIYNDYERLNSSDEAECQNACLKDCFCAAATFNLEGVSAGCWKKKAPLYNGKTDGNVQGIFWIKVGNTNLSSDQRNPYDSFPPLKTKNKVNSSFKALLGGSLSVNVLLISVVGLGILFMNHKKRLRVFDESKRKTLREYRNVHCFSYQELKEATNEFEEELGRGSFGIVYKGIISQGNPPICVAVKKLDRISGDTDKEFKTEVNAIGRTHHKNLVQLVGFCKQEDQRLLVYEYMSNGSLADYLFGDLRPSWIERVQIAQGIASGLLYLHEECSTQIIHCDIKPQNILLDEYQNARISDFGLAKLLILNQTNTITAIRGTKGYVASEWFRNKPVTVKVDVYSFGVLLLEIICCRKSVCAELVEEGGAILTDFAFDCYLSNRLDSLVNDDIEALSDIARLKRFVTVALWCVQEDPSHRPTMRMVMQMLEGLSEVPNNPPCSTSFSTTSQC